MADPDAALHAAKPGKFKPGSPEAAALPPLPSTGTIADTIEQFPNLRAVQPLTAPIEDPATFGETFSAAKRVARSDRMDFDEIRIRDGYGPIVEALGLPTNENPVAFDTERTMPLAGGTSMFGKPSRLATDAGMGSSTLGGNMRFASRELQERLIAEQIHKHRLTQPDFLKGVPDTVDGLHAYFLEAEKKKRAAATSTLARSSGLSGSLASLSGGVFETMHDPINLGTMPLGGGGKTILQVAAREALVNGAIELASQPKVAENRAELGEHLTLGEAAANTGMAAIGGGVLGGSLHVAGSLARPLIDPLVAGSARKLNEAVTALAARGMQIHINPKLPIDQALAELDNRSLVAIHRELAGGKETPDELDAGNVLERSQDVAESSPYQPGPVGDATHEGGLAEALNELQDSRAPEEFPSGSSGAGEAEAGGDPAPARPRDASTGSRPQGASVAPEDAIASFKHKVGGAENATGNVHAKNPRSSASGPAQFTDGTFRDYYRKVFGTDPGAHPSRDLKDDPQVQARLLDALTRDNSAHLQSIGEAVNDGNLYLEHFLGSRDAAKVFKAGADTPIERVLSADVIGRNPFLSGKSASETIAWAHKKMGGEASSVGARAGFASNLDPASEDPRVAQLRAEALQLDDAVIGITRLPDGTSVNLHASRVPSSVIGVDAERFQFKSGGDSEGVTDRLRGVEEWDPGLSGRVTLWEDASGKPWVADGHQRVALAKRISKAHGVEIPVDAMVLREADGISAEDARTWAAIKNIAEGSGSLTDAAKVVRGAGIEASKRLPPRSALVRDAAALSRLSDDAFGAVVNGIVPPDFAALVGHLLPDSPETHGAMIALLAKTEPANRGQAESIVRQGIAAGFHVEHQDDMFGGLDVASSLMLERAKVLEKGLAELRKMRLVHSTAATNADTLEATGSRIAREQSAKEATANGQAAEITSRLAFRAGPVADALNDAARSLAAGGKLGSIARDFAARVRELDLAALDRGGADAGGIGRGSDAGEAGAAVPEEPADPGEPGLTELEAATERFSDPEGEGVKQQAESLVHDLKAELEPAAPAAARMSPGNDFVAVTHFYDGGSRERVHGAGAEAPAWAPHDGDVSLDQLESGLAPGVRAVEFRRATHNGNKLTWIGIARGSIDAKFGDRQNVARFGIWLKNGEVTDARGLLEAVDKISQWVADPQNAKAVAGSELLQRNVDELLNNSVADFVKPIGRETAAAPFGGHTVFPERASLTAASLDEAAAKITALNADDSSQPLVVLKINEAAQLDSGAAVDPAIAERQRQELALKAASPLRSTAEQDGTMGLELFKGDQFGMELDAEARSLLDELDADEKAIKDIKDCL